MLSVAVDALVAAVGRVAAVVAAAMDSGLNPRMLAAMWSPRGRAVSAYVSTTLTLRRKYLLLFPLVLILALHVVMTLYIGIAHTHTISTAAHDRRGVRGCTGDGCPAALRGRASTPSALRAEAAPRQFFWPGMQPIAAIEEVDPGIAGAAAPAAVSADASDEEFLASLSNRPAASHVAHDVHAKADAARLNNAILRVSNRTNGSSGNGSAAAEPAGALLVEVEELKEGCRDGGPWPCNEQGCPAAMVGCSDMVHSCDHTFSEVFEKPPTAAMGALQVAALCPRACKECGADDAAADPCAGDPRDGDRPPECATGRGVWGAHWDERPPDGENRKYKPPERLSGYADFTDGTSRQLREKNGACGRLFHVGDRNDMKATVRPLLKELGVCETQDPMKADVIWSRPWMEVAAFFRPKQIHPGAVINSLAGLPQQIGQKMSLARLHRTCLDKFEYDQLDPLPKGTLNCRFTQRAFAVRRDGDKMQARRPRHRRRLPAAAAALRARPSAGEGSQPNYLDLWLLPP